MFLSGIENFPLESQPVHTKWQSIYIAMQMIKVSSKYFSIYFQSIFSNVSLLEGVYAWKRNGEVEVRDSP